MTKQDLIDQGGILADKFGDSLVLEGFQAAIELLWPIVERLEKVECPNWCDSSRSALICSNCKALADLEEKLE